MHRVVQAPAETRTGIMRHFEQSLSQSMQMLGARARGQGQDCLLPVSLQRHEVAGHRSLLLPHKAAPRLDKCQRSSWHARSA